MTRKYLEAIAAALKGARPKYEAIGEFDEGITAWETACVAVANAIAQHNKAFERERFLTNCGVK